LFCFKVTLFKIEMKVFLLRFLIIIFNLLGKCN
jgi:hypothetical protein